jgi:hypothetical protein
LRKNLKIAAVAATLFVALGAIAFVYASSQSSATANDDVRQMGMWNMRGFSEWNNVTLPDNVTVPCHMDRMPHMGANGLEWFNMLSENATLSTVNGTVVSEVNGMLILNTDTTQIRVLLPKEWSVGNEVIDRASLFNGTFASAGQSVTVKVLESGLFSNANFSVNVMLGYEAINATAVHAYAVLPFNIQPKS